MLKDEIDWLIFGVQRHFQQKMKLKRRVVLYI